MSMSYAPEVFSSGYTSHYLEPNLLRFSHSLHNLAKFLDGPDYEAKVIPNTKLHLRSLRDSLFIPMTSGKESSPNILYFLPQPEFLPSVECNATLVSPAYIPLLPHTAKPTHGNVSWHWTTSISINPKAGIIKLHRFYPPVHGIYFLILRESPTRIHLFALTRADVDRGVVRFSNKIKAEVASRIFLGQSVAEVVGDGLFEPYEFKLGSRPETIETPKQLLYRPSSNMVFQI